MGFLFLEIICIPGALVFGLKCDPVLSAMFA